MNYYLVNNQVVRLYHGGKRFVRFPAAFYLWPIYYAILISVIFTSVWAFSTFEPASMPFATAMIGIFWATLFAISPPAVDQDAKQTKPVKGLAIVLFLLLLCNISGVALVAVDYIGAWK
jgi:hypothetical protein